MSRLRATVEGHGWFDLAPHVWRREVPRLETVIELPAVRGRRAFDVHIEEVGGRQRVRRDGPDGPRTAPALERALDRMLRRNEELEAFYAACDDWPPLGWVRSAGVGRLLRSATLFEDLLKILFTTNCAWSSTRRMTARLVAKCGRPAPSGRRAFPSAAACAKLDEAAWRAEIGVGYRAPHAVRLAATFAGGELTEAHFEDPELSTDELRERLRALPGFGAYAAGQALRLLGRYDDLALDSWCRARGARLAGRRSPPSDAWFARRYRRFGRYAGLALWCELTADWHGEPA